VSLTERLLYVLTCIIGESDSRHGSLDSRFSRQLFKTVRMWNTIVIVKERLMALVHDLFTFFNKGNKNVHNTHSIREHVNVKKRE
jgi:hypothetical protein